MIDIPPPGPSRRPIAAITVGALGAALAYSAARPVWTHPNADMVAVSKSDGCMFFYGGHGDGTFSSRVRIGCGWNAYDQLAGIGDFDSDGHTDWIARRKSDGDVFLYRGDGAGRSLGRVQIRSGWSNMDLIA